MKSIEQNIIKFIKQSNLVLPGDKLLIALSGGPDSIFALNFFAKYKALFKIEIAAAHVNHNLRGRESDEDENFCKEICTKMNIPFHSISFNVAKIAEKNKRSIEEEARILRYNFLEDLLEKNGYTKIITAHNKNDNSETVLLNLFKGTGISGISGIPLTRGNIIRPLLNTSKEEIIAYLNSNKIEFRIDSSNSDSKYHRNFFRNEIIPRIKTEINPLLDDAIFRTSQNIRKSGNLLQRLILEKADQLSKYENEILTIQLPNEENLDKLVLDEIFRLKLQQIYGIVPNFDDSVKLLELVRNQTGTKIQISENLYIFKERNSIVIKEQKQIESIHILLKPNEQKIIGDIKISITEFNSVNGVPKYENGVEIISGDKSEDIFILRSWKNGDKFIPLGMTGSKLVSDFLNEQKVPAHLKKNVLVLTNGGKIVWVVGHRIDNRVKLLPTTKKAYKLCQTKL